MTPNDLFLAAKTFAVAGASRNRQKYGNQIFRALLNSGRKVDPINPAASDIEGHTVYASIGVMPVVPEALSIVTPPEITRQVMAAAVQAGVRHIWVQPGAVHHQASEDARAAGLNVIDDGSCVLVWLARES